MTSSEKASLQKVIEDARAIVDLLNEQIATLTELVSTEPIEMILVPAGQLVKDIGTPIARNVTNRQSGVKKPRSVIADQSQALIASIRRECATEASDFLKQHIGFGYRTSELSRHIPALDKRYVGENRKIAALNSILNSMGEQFNISNISKNSRALWMYRMPVFESSRK